MNMLNHILLLTIICGFALCQENLDYRLYPYEEKDEPGSPQIPLESRRVGNGDSPFIEDIPPGDFRMSDALLSKKQDDALYKELPIKKKNNVIGRAIVKDVRLRWTDATIPYVIDCSLERLEFAGSAIDAAIKEWQSKTCIKFVKRTTEKKYLRFKRDTHCWGNVGMSDYSTISCGYGCERQNVMSHEIGHAVGFYHEQNRRDRNSYVNIHLRNIGKFQSAFDIVKNTYSEGVAYDYGSIMHYPWTAFSSNGKATMSARHRTSLQPYVGVSSSDVLQTAKMYGCRGTHSANEQIEHDLKEEGINPEDAFFTEDCRDQSKNCAAWTKAGYCSYSHVIKLCRTSCTDPTCPGLDCVDKSEHCLYWKKQDFCKDNEYVKGQCCQTCTGPPPPRPPNPEENCVDKAKVEDCGVWKASGFCASDNKWSSYMKENCCSTCKKSDCVDQEKIHCKYWKEQGYCKHKSYKVHMKSNCCLTCKGTAPPTKKPTPPPNTKPPVTQPPPECKDESQHCRAWAKSGYCKSNSDYMLKSCCRSCKGTAPTTTKPVPTPPPNTKAPVTQPPPECQDKNQHCRAWAKSGYCKSNSDYMSKSCCQSCKGKIPATKKPITSKPDPDGKSERTYLGIGMLCEDMRSDCRTRASRGECKSNPGFMLWYCKISCRVTNCDPPGKTPEGRCTDQLGLSYKSKNYLPNGSFKSAYGHLTTGGWEAPAHNARLYQFDNPQTKQIGAWCANTGKTNPNRMQSLTINLGSRRKITHIATQGRDKYFERISEFKISYSNDGYNFQPFKKNGKDKVFIGSCDYRTPVVNRFSPTITAQYVRYIPWKWNYPCVRMEFYGC